MTMMTEAGHAKTFEPFDPAVHGPDADLYEIRSVQISDDIVGTSIVPSEIPYEDAVATPWYYMVKVGPGGDLPDLQA